MPENTKALGSELNDQLGADACGGLGIVGDGEPATIICCGKTTDEPCPTAEKCECGGTLELEYGFCRFGLGVFDRCQSCCAVYNFHEDSGA